MTRFSTAIPLNELPNKVPQARISDGVPIAIVRIDDEVFAVSDRCTHADVALSEGEVEGCSLECWLHGSAFDLRTGKPSSPPAIEPVAVYATRISGTDQDALVEVDVTSPINTESRLS